MDLTPQKKRGFTLIEIMIVVAIIGLLAGIAIPNFVKARMVSQTNACTNNLRLMSETCDLWAIDQKQPAGTAFNMGNLLPYLKGSNAPVCPAGGAYSMGNVGDQWPVQCSIVAHNNSYQNK